MRKSSILISLLFFASGVTWGGSPILRCEVQGEKISGSLRVDEDGAASLGFTANGRSPGKCRLKISDLHYSKGSVAPSTIFQFRNMGCEPPLSPDQKETLFDRYTLELAPSRNGERVGYLQWLRRGRASKCRFTVYEKESLNRNLKKWKEGVWGN